MNFQILNPQGIIASEQRELIFFVVGLMLLAVVPFFIMAATFIWKYRAEKKSKYSPNLDKLPKAQTAWTGLLVAIIIVLAITAYKSSHALDPRKPLVSEKEPIMIQAVALEWKWLFIYPEYNLATVNFIQFPEDTPVNFEITADAPMNSLWIPQLGGQMYAMNGMKTTLSIMAEEQGTYRGVSNNISGEGFADMVFQAKATSKADFDAWIATQQFYANHIDYEQLAKPSKNNTVAYYRVHKGLFESIVMKFMDEGSHVHVR